MKKPVLFDVETSDPDDVFALALLATHPKSNLVAVTIHPGGNDQVGVVRHVLNLLGRSDIPIGVGQPKSDKKRVSQFHYDWLGDCAPATPEWKDVSDLYQSMLRAYPTLHLVTGAALTNIVKVPKWLFWTNWTCQGGFAGDNVVPPEHRLPKFYGKLTCPTFNLNGDPKAAKELLCEPLPGTRRWMVSKNVCHGVFWDEIFNAKVPEGAHPGLDLIRDGMAYYFKQHPGGKALHDVIAAAAAINPGIATWKPVHPYRAPNGEWGCEPSDDPFAPMIMITLDRKGFLDTLVG